MEENLGPGQIVTQAPPSELFRLKLAENMSCNIIRLAVVFLQSLGSNVAIGGLLGLRMLCNVELDFGLFIDLLKRCFPQLLVLIRHRRVLFPERVSDTIDIFLVVVSLCEAVESRDRHAESVDFCLVFTLDFLKQFYVFLALRLDLAWFDQAARVEDDLVDFGSRGVLLEFILL